MAKADEQRAEEAGVRTDITVSPEPAHSTAYAEAQTEEDLKADPFPVGDPVSMKAQGITS